MPAARLPLTACPASPPTPCLFVEDWKLSVNIDRHTGVFHKAPSLLLSATLGAEKSVCKVPFVTRLVRANRERPLLAGGSRVSRLGECGLLSGSASTRVGAAVCSPRPGHLFDKSKIHEPLKRVKSGEVSDSLLRSSPACSPLCCLTTSGRFVCLT